VLGPSPSLEGIAEAEAFICPGNVRYDGARMDLAPKLRVIARLGVGYENIDVAAASARRIPVVYAPDAPTMSTAEHTWALILAMAKKVVAGESNAAHDRLACTWFQARRTRAGVVRAHAGLWWGWAGSAAALPGLGALSRCACWL
jgi:lactate dehydrogenase-like 2-hydroxyacid dehydrogenase